jgi:hypothetical protein
MAAVQPASGDAAVWAPFDVMIPNMHFGLPACRELQLSFLSLIVFACPQREGADIDERAGQGPILSELAERAMCPARNVKLLKRLNLWRVLRTSSCSPPKRSVGFQQKRGH